MRPTYGHRAQREHAFLMNIPPLEGALALSRINAPLTRTNEQKILHLGLDISSERPPQETKVERRRGDRNSINARPENCGGSTPLDSVRPTWA